MPAPKTSSGRSPPASTRSSSSRSTPAASPTCCAHTRRGRTERRRAPSAHLVECAGLGAQRVAVLGCVFLEAVVERLEADAQGGGGLLLVPTEVFEGGERELPLGFGERRADPDRERGRLAARDGRTPARRQAIVLDRRAGRHHVGAIDDVAQLADVAGPAIGREAPEDVAAEALDRTLALADLLQEVLRDQRDVVDPLAQRRQVDREHVEAIEQV